jgi:hypothetical protein
MAAAAATVVLDNEAVVALFDVRHRKHRVVLPYVEAAAQRRVRSPSLRVLVPVAVRIEAGWDRSDPAAAVINRVSGASDVVLTGIVADRARQLMALANVSVVDATVAEAAEGALKPAVILTSDVRDMATLADLVTGEVRVVSV